MPEERPALDPSEFTVRRDIRALLERVLGPNPLMPTELTQAIERLREHRALALRQLFRLHHKQRIADEIVALDLLGRLAGAEDVEQLARIVNDAALADSARVASAMVLLGHDRQDLIEAEDVSGMVLRWQARHLAEQPMLRGPLMSLYRQAVRQERVSWLAMQDQELVDPDARTAVFEMLLEIEDEQELRGSLLAALARMDNPTTRAALKRVRPRSEQEKEFIRNALVSLSPSAPRASVPAGWSARVGFCDGSGSFPLRFDFRLPGRRPRSSIFVLDLDGGVREALALTGHDVARYDRPAEESDGEPDGEHREDLEAGVRLFPLAVPESLDLLFSAEGRGLKKGQRPPSDYPLARRLLDPLGDVPVRALHTPRSIEPDPHEQRCSRLLDHPGYRGWFYDAGDHALDELRLEVLDGAANGDPFDERLIARATGLLARGEEPRRLLHMLRHNAMVHEAAGETAAAALALRAAQDVSVGRFQSSPLVRRMVRESLHPGLFFFTPAPAVPDREDFACLLLGVQPPTKVRVIAVDLAWLFSRVMEVWVSRVPSRERPHHDQQQQAALGTAQAGARWVVRWGRAEERRRFRGRHRDDEAGSRLHESGEQGLGSWRSVLARTYHAALDAVEFPDVPSDAGHQELVGLLVRATEYLIFTVCLQRCPHRCPERPRERGEAALRPGLFPAGEEIADEIRAWPGLFAQRPSPEQRRGLVTLMGSTGSKGPKGPRRSNVPGGSPRAQGSFKHRAAESFVCGVCGEKRRASTRSRTLIYPAEGAEALPVCRRCQGRCRRDVDFRRFVEREKGRLEG
ncbi:MAG: hypothetical protein JSV80_16830 [Acidobacteriota bacterium]|nr:MAG: hypothetical protein JSV80_16830 [Acidobacteriota bacterium]